jgi:dolichyl-phosphate-mannose-protein mannosyltransferase
MAVLAPERAEEEPLPSPARTAARRRPRPRPRRDGFRPLPDDDRRAWALTALLGGAAFAVRLWGINYPRNLLFDEAYYPPQARQLLTWGFEYNRGYSFIVHPPLGKWFIAVGEQLFGYNSFGWRFPSAVAGALAVVVLVRLARRLTGSTLLGLAAGLLLALDAFSFTLSRIGLLDAFVQVLVLGAVACLVVDRDSVRERIATAADVGTTGFRLGPRTWRIAAGVLFGAACAVKWSGVWFLAFFAIASLFWERAAWREAGVPRPTWVAARRGLPGAVWALAVLPVLTYLASFTGWFLGETSQGKAWAQQNPDTAYPFVPDALRSLWHEHAQWLTFHNGLSSPHPWESGPWSWLVTGRPILLWNPQGLTDPAGEQVVRYILMVGTPVLWFAFVPASLWLLWRIAARRDPAAGVVAVAIAAGWGTWLLNLERTMFIFYMAPVLPFFVLAVTLVLQDVLGSAHEDRLRRRVGLGVVCLYLALVAVSFVYFYPVLTGQPLSRDDWWSRMWFHSWL